MTVLCDCLRSCGYSGTLSPMGDVRWSSIVSLGNLFSLGDVLGSTRTGGTVVVSVTVGVVSNGNLFPLGDVPWSTMTGGTVVVAVTLGVNADTRGGLDYSRPSPMDKGSG